MGSSCTGSFGYRVSSATCFAGRGFVTIFFLLTPPLKHCHEKKYVLFPSSSVEQDFLFFLFVLLSFCTDFFSKKAKVGKKKLPPNHKKPKVKNFNQKAKKKFNSIKKKFKSTYTTLYFGPCWPFTRQNRPTSRKSRPIPYIGHNFGSSVSCGLKICR